MEGNDCENMENDMGKEEIDSEECSSKVSCLQTEYILLGRTGMQRRTTDADLVKSCYRSELCVSTTGTALIL